MITYNPEDVRELIEEHAKFAGLNIVWEKVLKLPCNIVYDENGYLLLCIVEHPYLNEVCAHELGFYSRKNGWKLVMEAERFLKEKNIKSFVMVDREGTLDRYYTRLGFTKQESCYVKELI